MQFSRPFERFEVFSEAAADGTAQREHRGSSLLAALHWATAAGKPLLVKCGISAVSAEGALRNLQAELPGWDCDATRAAASATWERELARLQLATFDPRHTRMLYTALYHSLLAPTLFNDVDGQYRGMDLAVHQLPAGASNYTQFSLWDSYRSLHPLLTLLQPERVPDLVNSLIRMAEQRPQGVPVWPLQGRETGCMIGYHSAVVLAEAQAKNFTGIDFRRAWPLWRRRAMDDDYRGLPLYRRLGFIPADQEEEATSKTLEYAYDDWALAHLARGVGSEADHALLRERSRNHRNVFDANARFVRPRLANGRWAEPFDPRALGHSARRHDFTESNAWQATFLNQHDVANYMQLFGGETAFVAQLDALFATSSEQLPGAPPDIAGLIGQYAHGNEPSHHVAYLYAYAGQPWIVFNHAMAARQFGRVEDRTLARHGLAFIQRVHAQPQGGHAWLLDWHAGKATVLDATQHCYGQAFVLLAHAHALMAGVDEAAAGLRASFELMEQRFWEPAHSLYADEATPDWQLSAYRGQNANMHACEAMLAAHEATGEARYLQRALLLAESVTQRLAGLAGGLVWEHYRGGGAAPWSVDWDYNRDDRSNIFRPWGYQTGHLTEWAKLLLQLERRLGLDAAPAWLLGTARHFFDTAMRHGWDDAHGGLVYGFGPAGPDGRAGAVCDADKYFWVQAESLAAAAWLAQRTGEDAYWAWYERLWSYAWQHFVDHEHGAWYRVLGPDNRKLSDEKSPAGKTDYHTMGACYDVLRACGL